VFSIEPPATKELETNKETEKRKRLAAEDGSCPMIAAMRAISEVGDDCLLQAWLSTTMIGTD